MTDAERREASRQFYNKWRNRGKEDEDDRSYWLDILDRVLVLYIIIFLGLRQLHSNAVRLS